MKQIKICVFCADIVLINFEYFHHIFFTIFKSLIQFATNICDLNIE